MSETNAYAAPRWLVLALAFIGALTLLIAVIITPIGDWDRGTWVMAIATAVVTVMWLIYGIRGGVDLLGKWNGRTGAIVSALAAFVSGVIVGSVIFTDTWGAQEVLMTGLFLALALLFAAAFWLSTKKMKAGA
jgi:hypothetical protein